MKFEEMYHICRDFTCVHQSTTQNTSCKWPGNIPPCVHTSKLQHTSTVSHQWRKLFSWNIPLWGQGGVSWREDPLDLPHLSHQDNQRGLYHLSSTLTVDSTESTVVMCVVECPRLLNISVTCLTGKSSVNMTGHVPGRLYCSLTAQIRVR